MMGGREFGRICDPRSAGFAEWRFDRIDQAVKVTETQRPLFEALKTASAKAQETVRASCPTDWPSTAPGRLAAMEKRHEAMLQATKVVRPALDAFYASLTDEQKARFERVGPRQGWGGMRWWRGG
jgi:hypothetical protein